MHGWDFGKLVVHSQNARLAVISLHSIGPTTRVEDRTVKGWEADDSGTVAVYYTSDELRQIADGLVVIAQWLDNRASAGAEK